jgi:Tol biopolymer transport system component
MPDVREVYEMVTQQTPPNPDALERQRKRQIRHTMNRRLGGLAAAAAIIGLAVFVTIRASSGDGTGRPAEGPTAPRLTPSVTPLPVYDPSVPTAPWYTTTATPDSDYLIDVNTGEMTTLPQAIVDTRGPIHTGRYAASPDGSTIAFVGLTADDTHQIFTADIDGTRLRQVTHDPRGATSPAWSPNGASIAYESYSSQPVGKYGLAVLDLATGQTTKVIDVPRSGTSPTFTPDGDSLIYTGGTDEMPVLRIVPIGGGSSRLFVGAGEGITDAGNGTVSPDGSLVTFLGGGFPESGEGGGCGPCRLIAKADGTERRVVPGWMANPAGMWSPDSSRIVVMDGGDRFRSVILVVDVATEAATVVANGDWAIWVDNDTLLVQV